MTSDIKAIILAAGKGTRMKSSTPKVLHSVMGKTLVERVIDNVFKIDNLSEIFTIVGHQSDRVTEFITSKYTSVDCILQQPQLGTGDAVFKAYDRLKGFEGTVIVLCGDTPLLTTETLNNFVSHHKETGSDLTVLSAIIDPSTNYGRIVRNAEGNVTRIVEEKDASSEEKAIKEVNAGVYCIEWKQVSPAFFELTTNNEQGEYYLTDIVGWSVGKGMKVQAFVLEDNNEIFGINSKLDLAHATSLLNSKTLKSLMTEGVTIVDPKTTWIAPETTIGADTVVYPGCYIEGSNSFGVDCLIGPHVHIDGGVTTGDSVTIAQSKVSDTVIGNGSVVGPFAHIRQGAEIGEKVRIGNFVEVKKSKINSNTNAAHLSYVGDAEVGSHVNIGAGTITANYNALTREKSKTLIEDEVKIGSNSVLVAPITIGKGANVGAGSVITKDIPEYSLGITRGPLKIFQNWVRERLDSIKK